MQHNSSQATLIENSSVKPYIYATSIEVASISPLAFFVAGDNFKGERYFWQDRDNTSTIVGLGYAHTIKSQATEKRFDEVEQAWQQITAGAPQLAQAMILFGGATFDPYNDTASEWGKLPHAHFVVATHQLVVKGQKSFLNTHYISATPISDAQKHNLQAQAQALLRKAQQQDLQFAKPLMTNYSEPFKEAYLQSIDEVTARIRSNEAQKVVIARSLALQFNEATQAEQLLAHTLAEQPESYIFGFEYDDQFFFGASPERLVMVTARHAYSSCIAGSIKRGTTPEQDAALGTTLLTDAKNGGEHQYVVDMIADIFAKNCTQYTVPNEPQLLKTRDIQHLYTPIEGDLQAHTTILQLVKDLHPTPALGGVPRDTAFAMIREAEPMNRGFYAGPIGWLDSDGDGEFAVAIRSAMATANKAYLYAGGGIVADSEALSEYDETLVKFRPMLRTLGGKNL